MVLALFFNHRGATAASMNIPKDLKYTKEHEWVVIDSDGIATIGITDFAQNSLGDITFVQLPREV